ncbi:hypothetical protein BCAR13_1550001 [Paraburkholderia caribensis]|nr:hypothetical protein BCAR13_1550001 [Paraburkholderia caribensis]
MRLGPSGGRFMGPMGGFLHSECEFFAKGVLPFWIPWFLFFYLAGARSEYRLFGFCALRFGLSATLGGLRGSCARILSLLLLLLLSLSLASAIR